VLHFQLEERPMAEIPGLAGTELEQGWQQEQEKIAPEQPAGLYLDYLRNRIAALERRVRALEARAGLSGGATPAQQAALPIVAEAQAALDFLAAQQQAELARRWAAVVAEEGRLQVQACLAALEASSLLRQGAPAGE
jgi:hypothetical protein